MLRRRRVPKSLRMYQQLPLAKPMSRRREKVLRDADDAEHVSQIRLLVWIRSAGRCELCGCWLGMTSLMDDAPGEMHHDPPRSLVRGKPESEITNERTCCRSCAECHSHQTYHRRLVVFWTERRFMGPYAVVNAAGEVLFQKAA